MSFSIEEFLKKIPRPNRKELPSLYETLDAMTRTIAAHLMKSHLYEPDTGYLHFEKADEEDIFNLISQNPGVFVPFFMMVCGFSQRELEKRGLKDAYGLRKRVEEGKARKFSKIVKENLRADLSIEVLLFKFYKNWEEHQKRHYRGQIFEEQVREFLRKHGYACEKVTAPEEIDAAIPPERPEVAIAIRTGVFRDIAKRAKEFREEKERIERAFPSVRFFVVVFGIEAPNPRELQDKFLQRLRNYGPDPKAPHGGYDAIIFGHELEKLIDFLERHGIEKTGMNDEVDRET